MRGDRLVAAAVLFRTDYRLDLSLEGPLKPAGEWLYKNAPKLVVVPVLGLGSAAHRGVPDRICARLTPQRAPDDVSRPCLHGMDAHAQANEIPLLALKDITDRDDGLGA